MVFENFFLQLFKADLKQQIKIQNTDFLFEDNLLLYRLMNKKSLNREENILLCCYLSGLTYNYNFDFHFEYCQVHRMSTGLVYLMVSNGDSVYIAFKGSSNLNDFITDINIKLEKTKNFPGKTHKGFTEMLIEDNVYIKIIHNLRNFISNFDCKNIYITGHSLGAALSTLFYSLCKRYRFFVEKNLNIENISFGSPRLGDFYFTENLNITRIVNGGDIVTKIPFPFCYRHSNILNKINKRWFSLPSIQDHDISKYYEKLKRFI